MQRWTETGQVRCAGDSSGVRAAARCAVDAYAEAEAPTVSRLHRARSPHGPPSVHTGTAGEVEYPEFLEIMTIQLTRMAQQKVDASAPPAMAAAAAAGNGTTQPDGSGQGAGLNMASVLPFDVVATAYRRKKLMGALEEDDK